MAPTWASQPWHRRFRCGDGQFSPEKIPVGERDDNLDGSFTRLYLVQSTNLERNRMVIVADGDSLMRAASGASTEVSFLVLVGISTTITVEHARCRTVQESYWGNKVSFLGLG